MNTIACRFCAAALARPVVDLGMSPLCERYIAPERANAMEPFYPLQLFVCPSCRLAQLGEFVGAEQLFSEYAYFSSYSTSWLQHAADYCARMTARLALGPQSFVVELASNDGYLLRNFVRMGIPCLGVEPAANVAAVAERQGVPTRVDFFGERLARQLTAEGRQADLVVGNNVLAQVPDLHDFAAGVRTLLKPGGVATFEFPHLVRLIEGVQYDTIYHEHFSYFSLLTAGRVFAAHGLRVFDVEELPTHGGSLRIHLCHAADARPESPAVAALRAAEVTAGYDGLSVYTAFAKKVEESKRSLLTFLIEAKRQGKQIAGYGAPGKGNTLLNYCGIRTDLLAFTVDRNPCKVGMLLPGTRIPILPVERLLAARPDYVLILPWNLREEIVCQLACIREWGGQFVVPIPMAEVLG